MLGDYGADVVWIEPPGGDPFRDCLAVDYSVSLRNKRSVVLDLATDAGKEALATLVASADVFVESWRPGVAERLGLDRDTIRVRAPHVVSCSITGFGTDGPHRDTPGHEALVHAIAGTTGEQVGMRPSPIFEGVPFAAAGAASLGLVGVLAALYRREIDGVGRHVETSLYDGALAYLMMLWGDSDRGAPPHVPGRTRIVARTFLCSDGEYLGVHTGAVGAFGRLMKVLGIDDRIPAGETPREMGIPLTDEQAAIVEHEIPAIFETASRSEWLRRLREADICAVEHLHPGECFDAEQVLHNGMVVTIDDPQLGPIEQVAPPIRLSVSPPVAPAPAPVVGAHTNEVLAEWVPAGDADPEQRPVRTELPLLDGVKILDLGAFYAGPYASRLLADLGADVIKLEPVGGDPLRGLQIVFRSAQAGKRSIAADLKADELATLRRALVEWADVLHHNMRPGAAERLGLADAQVRPVNPNVVYVYSPGWGSSGPDQLRQSFAPMLAGYVGAGFEVAGRYNPPLFPTGNEDPGGGLTGAAAILLGLVHRQRMGVGQYIESPQLNAALAGMSHIVRRPDGEVLGAGRLDPMQYGLSALERLYPTTDGWICLSALTDREVAALRARFGDRVDLLHARDLSVVDDALGDALAALFADVPTAELLADLAAAGVPAAEAKTERNAKAFLDDPENHRTRRAARAEHPDDGTVREIDQLIRVDGARCVEHRIAPGLGEHTDEILKACGYAPDAIADLRARHLVR
jgi:crotonobetainyl-CoA:carnitine CoA-transferase CaiB-like acyl-CoA transferase